MPQRPSLHTPMPLLLGTSMASRITSLEGLASLLEASHRVVELEALQPRLQGKTAPRLDAATLAMGEIALTSIWGSALTLAVEPLAPLCMLALPAIGWGVTTSTGRRSTTPSAKHSPFCRHGAGD